VRLEAHWWMIVAVRLIHSSPLLHIWLPTRLFSVVVLSAKHTWKDLLSWSTSVAVYQLWASKGYSRTLSVARTRMLQVPQEVVRILVVAFRACHTPGYTRVATYYSFLPLVIRTSPTHRANKLLPLPDTLTPWPTSRHRLHPIAAYLLAKARWPLDAQKTIFLNPVEPTIKSESRFDEYNTLPQEVDSIDVLQLYKRGERTPGLYLSSPLERWRRNHTRYPLLRHLAFALFAIPATESANKRTFSITGSSVGNDRPMTL
jgi:hypothetical protein